MRVYLAGPFFNEKELLDNTLAEEILQSKDLDIFVPRKHFIPNGENLPHSIWAQAVYHMDISEIKKCDIVVLLYSGLYSDSGTAFECGYANALNIPIITVYLNDNISSLMITNASHANLIGLQGLKEYDFNKLEKIEYPYEQK